MGLHVDAMPVSSLIENAFKVFGLDLNGLMCDNILAYLPCVYSIFTTLELSPDPLYDKDANKPWWELAWNAVVECIADIVRWYNNIDIGIKIGVGLGLFIVSCVLNCITNGAWSVVELSLRYIIGVLSATAVSVFFAALSGQSLGAAAAYGFVDAVFLGGIFEFVSAGINALKVGIRSIKSTAPQPVIRDGVEIRHAQHSDFTDEAWEKINNISHDVNGNTISSLNEGNAIHKGFMVGQRGSVAGGGLKGGRGYFDGFDDFNKIIYELKPNNPASINKGIAQLKRYQNVMIAQGKGSYKLVLVLY